MRLMSSMTLYLGSWVTQNAALFRFAASMSLLRLASGASVRPITTTTTTLMRAIITTFEKHVIS